MKMRKKHIYLIGIKGVAMTALAVYFIQRGFEVSGSDVNDEFLTDKILADFHIPVKRGFNSKNIDRKYDFVIVTGAHGGMTNPEAVYAKKLGIPTYMHGEFLGKLVKEKDGIAVAGCHGKTTTSAVIASLLTHAGFAPSYIIGTASINDLGPAGHFGSGKYFIAEADEYMTCPMTCKKPRFLWQRPKLLVITNIEYDHPDAYVDIDAVKIAFLEFCSNLPDDGLLIACVDNRNITEILPAVRKQVITYGFSPKADYRIERFYFGEGRSFMKISYRGMSLGEYMIAIPGKHNLLNVLGACIAVNLVGVDWNKIKENIKLFTGTKRRFEKISEYNGIALYDDYAHHPTEIMATIAGARAWFQKRRIIVIFQPHTYSRTRSLLKEFGKAFGEADTVLITDIYPSAREVFDPNISSKMLEIEANKNKKNTYYLSNKKAAFHFLKEKLKPNDIVITMGAGDIYTWHNDLIKLIKSYG